MNMTIGVQALLERVAKGATTEADAVRLRQWLFPDEQAQIVKAYLMLTGNVEKVHSYIAADLRLALATSLLHSENEALDRLELNRLFVNAIHLYDEYRNQHGFDAKQARHAAVADSVERIRETIKLLNEGEL